MEILPTLDLYNFTEPIATESQYILTSPRSLEACARFGIKPVELLPKTTEEFEADYGSFTENPAVLYKKFEKERLRKLRLCRQERERIIDESALGDSENESLHEEILSSGEDDSYCIMDSPREKNSKWKENGTIEKPKSIDKPNILDYLDATNGYPAGSASINGHLNHEDSPVEYLQDNSPCDMTQRTLSDPVIFPMHDGENGMHTKKNKREKLKRSKSLKAEKEKKIDASTNDVESYEKMNGCNDNHSSPSPTMTYRVSSDSGVFPVQASSQKKTKPIKIKRTQSFRVKRENSGEMDEITDALPNAMKENLSLLSKTDRKLLDAYLLKMTGHHAEGWADCAHCRNTDVKSVNKINRRMSCPASKTEREREDNSICTHSRNEKVDAELQSSKWKSKYEKQAQKMDQKLNSIEKERQFGKEINSNANTNKWQKRKAPPKSPGSPGVYGNSFFHDEQKNGEQLRKERSNQLNEITERHKKAGETFQERMRQKLQLREYNKLKQQERKDFQERQLHMMEKDLKLWQKELKAYQDICLNRASKVVEKRNAITSAKTHEKRHQKEIEHAMLKSRVDQDERRRQEELKQLVNIKDTRSKMIISAKEEYANAGRESAHMPRSYRNGHKNSYQSSFDKMAYKGERMARLEQLSSAKKAPQNSSQGGMKQRKNQSVLTLG